MPLVRPLGENLYEARSDLKDKIARIFFTLKDNRMVLTPSRELELAKKRLSSFKKGGD